MAGEVGTALESYIYKNESHCLVKPTSRTELEKAFIAARELQELASINDGDTRINIELLAEQESMIKQYVDVLGEFDSTIFSRNITYLAKKKGMRMAELESCLGISSGYISRTMKESSGKKMSIDMAWKIARVLDVNLHDLISKDMQNQRGNTAMVVKFIDKLTMKTRDAELEWQVMGGYISQPDKILFIGGIITKGEDGIYYNPDWLGIDEPRPLAGDVMRLPAFVDGKEDLYLVPYKGKDDDHSARYEFLTVVDRRKDKKNYDADIEWRKFFSVNEAVDNDSVNSAAQNLHDAIVDQMFDVKVTPDYKSFIEVFLND